MRDLTRWVFWKDVEVCEGVGIERLRLGSQKGVQGSGVGLCCRCCREMENLIYQSSCG